MRVVSKDSLYDLKLYLREMKGNSVNYNETDSLIKEYLSIIEELLEEENEDLLEKILNKGEYLVDHLNNLSIHATANYWAKERHLKYSEKFDSTFDRVKQRIKYRDSY